MMRAHTRYLLPLTALLVTITGCCFLRPGWVQRFRPLTYTLHSSISSAWAPSIANASTTWNGVFPLFTYAGYNGQASGNFQVDGRNSVFQASLPNPTALGTTRGTPDQGTCGFIDTDFGFNNNVPWSSTTPFSWQYDVESTALHELGHFGQLGHVICPSSSVMVDFLNPGTMKRSLRACDSLGMRLTNAIPECYILTGICFPSFFAVQAFDDSDDEDQGTVDPFGSYYDEMTQIWKGDATLRANSDSLGDFYSRMLDDWRNGGTLADSEYFTSARYQELDTKIISRMYTSASTSLRQRLNSVRSVLQGKIGRRLSATFGSDVRLSKPAGGYEPPGGGGPPPI
jgi:hypothetical protein